MRGRHVAVHADAASGRNTGTDLMMFAMMDLHGRGINAGLK